MPRDLTPALQAHLLERATRLCLCYRLERTDGVVEAYTTATRKQVIDGLTYAARSGFTPSELQNQIGTGIDTTEVFGIVRSPNIDPKKVAMGLYDGAELTVYLADWLDADATAGVLHKGDLGGFKHTDGESFSAVFTEMLNRAAQPIVRVLSGSCDAMFCDARCGLDIMDFTHAGEVTAVDPDNRNITIDLTGLGPNYFGFGHLTWLTGDNAPIRVGIKGYDEDTGEIELFQAARYTIEVGDTFDAVAGCGKLPSDCKDPIRDNFVNFRGNPFTVGNEWMVTGQVN